MLSTILDAVKLVRSAWPKRWSNVEARFLVDEMGKTFVCDGKGQGVLRLSILDGNGQQVAYLEGENSREPALRTGCNLEGMSDVLLAECFQMARCYREFERTGDLELSRNFQYNRTGVVWLWERSRDADAFEDD